MRQHVADYILERAAVEGVFPTQVPGVATVDAPDEAAVRVVSPATLYQLLLLNIVLQIFDGIATYNGVSLGLKEANPLLAAVFEALGVGTTLLLFKSGACALLLLLYWRGTGVLVLWGYALLAGLYYACSLVPWLAAYVALFVRYL